MKFNLNHHKFFTIDNSCGYRALAIGFWYIKNGFGERGISKNDELYSNWRKLIQEGGSEYSDVHQRQNMINFVEKANKYFHQFEHNRFYRTTFHPLRCRENPCDICDSDRLGEDPIEKCAQAKHCAYFRFPTFDRNKPFGQSNDDFRKMQEFLESEDVNLMIYDSDYRRSLWFQPGDLRNMRRDNTICLVRSESKKPNGEVIGHFDYLKSVESFLKTDHFCYLCRKGFNQMNHKCEKICQVCGKEQTENECQLRIDSEEQSLKPIDCQVCLKTFFNQGCYEHHLKQGTPFYCSNFQICENCGIRYRKTSKCQHECFKEKCHFCGKIKQYPHYCFMKPLDKKKLQEEDALKKIIVTFDIESNLINDANGNMSHQPILLISSMILDFMNLFLN